jgi:RNA polymerase sigma-70 factor, ECF subfamily
MYAANDEEADLIRRLQVGEDEAFEMMVRLYGGRMLAIARRFLRVEQDARDAVQEALLSAFRSIGEFSGQSRLSTWLHRIVVNAALMQIRSRKRQRESSIEELLPHFDDQGSWLEEHQGHYNFGEQHLEERDTRELVRRCIARLPDSYRNVLLMRDIEDRDYLEIAALLEARPGTVKIRLHRARLALRNLIVKEIRDRSHQETIRECADDTLAN